MTLPEEYAARLEAVLSPLADAIQAEIVGYLAGELRIDRITARPKSVSRFLDKAQKMEDGKRKYTDPLIQIQDQVGARVVVFYEADVDRISGIVERYLRPIETKRLVPDHHWKFGYFGKHFIFLIPTHLIDPTWPTEMTPFCFELQIKTLYQHAWSEANHDLGYKPGELPLDGDQERLLAYTSAQSWGADRAFSQLFAERMRSEAA